MGDDVVVIEKEILDELKLIFVTREECDTITDGIKEEANERKSKIDLMEQKLDTIVWIGKTTLGAVLVAIVGAIMAIILK